VKWHCLFNYISRHLSIRLLHISPGSSLSVYSKFSNLSRHSYLLRLVNQIVLTSKSNNNFNHPTTIIRISGDKPHQWLETIIRISGTKSKQGVENHLLNEIHEQSHTMHDQHKHSTNQQQQDTPVFFTVTCTESCNAWISSLPSSESYLHKVKQHPSFNTILSGLHFPNIPFMFLWTKLVQVITQWHVRHCGFSGISFARI